MNFAASFNGATALFCLRAEQIELLARCAELEVERVALSVCDSAHDGRPLAELWSTRCAIVTLRHVQKRRPAETESLFRIALAHAELLGRYAELGAGAVSEPEAQAAREAVEALSPQLRTAVEDDASDTTAVERQRG